MSLEEELNYLFESVESNEEDLLRKYIRAEKNSALSFLVVGVVHDSKGFITPIFGAAEMGIGGAREGKIEERIAYFNMILESAEKLDALISNLLDFSKRKDYTRETVYINDLLESVIRLCRPQYVHEQVNLKTDLKEVPVINGYQAGLESVFMNMLTNAMQAYEGIPKEQSRTVQVRSYHKEGYVVVEFEDDGCGIKNEDLPYIFDFLYTTKDTIKEKGSGIGLANAMMIIKDSHFGKIYVDSEYGKGTKFTIKIPDAKTIKMMREETFFGNKREPSSEN